MQPAEVSPAVSQSKAGAGNGSESKENQSLPNRPSLPGPSFLQAALTRGLASRSSSYNFLLLSLWLELEHLVLPFGISALPASVYMIPCIPSLLFDMPRVVSILQPGPSLMRRRSCHNLQNGHCGTT